MAKKRLQKEVCVNGTAPCSAWLSVEKYPPPVGESLLLRWDDTNEVLVGGQRRPGWWDEDLTLKHVAPPTHWCRLPVIPD